MIDHRGVIGEPAVVTEAALLAREQALEGRGPMAADGRALRLEIVDADLQPRLARELKLSTNDACTQITRMLFGCA